MTVDKPDQPDQTPAPAPEQQVNPYPELDELQQEVAKRLRDNQRFLAHFLDEDFADEAEEDTESQPDDFEEL